MVLVVEEHGTFVYRVHSAAGSSSALGLRTEPSVGEESKFSDKRAYAQGDLVAVECVQPSRVGSNNGAFAHVPSRSFGGPRKPSHAYYHAKFALAKKDF